MGRDPTRIAAQIVAGVDFLGAAAIFRSGSDWVAAGLGVLCGGGNHLPAISAAVFTVIVLLLPANWSTGRSVSAYVTLSATER